MRSNFPCEKDVYYGTFAAPELFVACGFTGWWNFHRMPHGEQPIKDFIFNIHR